MKNAKYFYCIDCKKIFEEKFKSKSKEDILFDCSTELLTMNIFRMRRKSKSIGTSNSWKFLQYGNNFNNREKKCQIESKEMANNQFDKHDN